MHFDKISILFFEDLFLNCWYTLHLIKKLNVFWQHRHLNSSLKGVWSTAAVSERLWSGPCLSDCMFVNIDISKRSGQQSFSIKWAGQGQMEALSLVPRSDGKNVKYIWKEAIVFLSSLNADGCLLTWMVLF